MAREENDSYPTPPRVAKAASEAVKLLVPHTPLVIEPSAGSGVFVKEAVRLWPNTHVVAVEIDERHRQELASVSSYTYIERWQSWVARAAAPPGIPAGTLVMGNPPFAEAEEHVGLALDFLPAGSFIAFLLKMNFLCSKKRAQHFWPKGQLRWIRPFDARPSFKKSVRVVEGKTVKSSNDTNEYAMFVWEVGYQGRAEIVFPHISWTNENPT